MTTSATGPAKNPCGSCPYRCDVPAGIWHPDEYAKLPAYDRPTGEQPPSVFLCHQQDGRMCAGWVGHADQSNLLALRLWGLGASVEDIDAVLDYECPVDLFPSGAAAAEHGLSGVEDPDEAAARQIDRLLRKGKVPR